MREGIRERYPLSFIHKTMKYISTLLPFLILLFSGCHSKPEEFTLIYTMESTGNYKISIEIDKDKNFTVRQQNIFFDNLAGKEQINTAEGKMIDEDHAELTELIYRSRLFNMEDAYGFKQNVDLDDPFGGFIYQLTYTEGKKTKYISIRTNETDRFPEPFLQLINFLSNYMSKHAPEA